MWVNWRIEPGSSPQSSQAQRFRRSCPVSQNSGSEGKEPGLTLSPVLTTTWSLNSSACPAPPGLDTPAHIRWLHARMCMA